MTALVCVAAVSVLAGVYCLGLRRGARDTREHLHAVLDAAENDWRTALEALRRLSEVSGSLTAEQRRVVHGVERAAARRASKQQ